ncbi:MAG: efflux RND transporter periplasmic adaptor subunit [Acidobacteriota bacterium]
MKKQTKTALIVVAVAAAAGFLGWQIIARIIQSSKTAGGPRGPAPVAVEIQSIERADIQNIGTFTGSLIPKSQFIISPKISGKLKKLFVNIGDRVKRGQIMAILDDEEYRQQLIQAEADLNVAQANLEETRSATEFAERELERVKQLHARGISADSELDSAKGAFSSQGARFKVAQAQVANRESAKKAAELRLSYTRIQAAWDEGAVTRVVGERFVDEGALLSVNSPMLSILEIEPLIAVIHVSDKDYFKLEVGQSAEITTAAVSGRKAIGRIARIAPLLQETSREARLEIEFSNPDEVFKPGMFIRARIEFGNQSAAVVVPVSSIVNRMDRQGIFLIDRETKTARFVPVVTGIISGDIAEILEPENLSGEVVVLGQHLLIPDSPVILSEEDGESPSSGEKSPPEKKSVSEKKRGDRP